MTTTEVKIRVETDNDFTLNFPKFAGPYNIDYNGYRYKLRLVINDIDPKSVLLHFLNNIEIRSCKEYHEEMLETGIKEYQKQIKDTDLRSCYTDILGGGNWSFLINVFKWEEV